MMYAMLLGIIVILMAILIGTLKGVDRLLKAVFAVYQAGYWKAEGISAFEADRLWRNLRAAAAIPPGTATALGVGDTH